MNGARLEVRLDTERREKLGAIAASRQMTVSEFIRDLIDRAVEDSERAYRMKLVEEIANMNIEDVPDPDELSRQLESTHDIPDLY